MPDYAVNILTVVQALCVHRSSCGMVDGLSRLLWQKAGGELNTVWRLSIRTLIYFLKFLPFI